MTQERGWITRSAQQLMPHVFDVLKRINQASLTQTGMKAKVRGRRSRYATQLENSRLHKRRL